MLRLGRKNSGRTGVRAALLAGATVAALGLGGLGASGAAAAPLCTGSNITGQGSSLQKIAQQEIWAPTFSSSVCPGGPTITYNSTGSGGGLKEWNHDGKRGSINTSLQFIGTDDAPTSAQIANITSVAGGAKLAVIPTAQTAIAVIANPPAGCTVEDITNVELDQMFRGQIAKWSKLNTAEGAGCDSAVTRVVRKDGSGTTYQFKNYLYAINTKKLSCTTGGTEGQATWAELEPITNGETGAPNTTWPESCAEKTLSALVKPSENGNGAVVSKVNATAGSIAYTGLPDAKAGGAKILLVQNNGTKGLASATFASPASGEQANCGKTVYKVPADGQQIPGASGLNVDWSQVFGAKINIGEGSYPLCTLTFDLAFHGYQAAGFTFKNYVTVYDYLREYIPFAGQTDVAAKYYSALPTNAWAKYNVLGAAKLASGKITF